MSDVRAAFFDVARQLGLTTIFGNPGSTEETMLRSFPDDLTYVLALQEAPAVSMADAYARHTRHPVLVNLHTAAGMGNALAAIETAYYDQTPLIIVAGQQTRTMLLHEPFLINPSPQTIAAPFVKWAYETVRAVDAPGALMRAYAVATQAPAGPVFLSIPMDDFERDFDGDVEVRTVSPSTGADPRVLAPVIDALSGARSPALVFGGGNAHGDGWAQGVALAEKTRARVFAAPLEGRLGFPETHPQFHGFLPTGMQPIADALDGSDVIVVIGAPAFRYYPDAPGRVLPPTARLFQITDDPSDAAAAWTGSSFLADPPRACEVLRHALPDTERPSPPPPPAPDAPDADRPIPPAYLYAVIERERPVDSIIVHESLSTQSLLHQHIPTAHPDSCYAMTSGALGFGLPAGVGVALAEQHAGTGRKVVTIVGDGSANYTIQGLWTAAQRDADVLFVVVRNHAYTILKAFGEFLHTPGVQGLDLPGLDFVALARGYGLDGERVDDPAVLPARVGAAIERRGPYLIEVVVDHSVPPLMG